MPRLNAPTLLIFLISLVLAALALVDYIQPGQLISPLPAHNPFWLAVSAYVVLMIGNLIKGL